MGGADDMLINKPQFDIHSLELKLGSAIWVESTIYCLRHHPRTYGKSKQFGGTPAIITAITPLRIDVRYYDSTSNKGMGDFTILIDDVVQGNCYITAMVPKKNELEELLDEATNYIDPFYATTHPTRMGHDLDREPV